MGVHSCASLGLTLSAPGFPSLGLWEETQREKNLLFMGEAVADLPQHVAWSFPLGGRFPVEWSRAPHPRSLGLRAAHGAAPAPRALRPSRWGRRPVACSRAQFPLTTVSSQSVTALTAFCVCFCMWETQK